jgi:hypothetical protein
MSYQKKDKLFRRPTSPCIPQLDALNFRQATIFPATVFQYPILLVVKNKVKSK